MVIIIVIIMSNPCNVYLVFLVTLFAVFRYVVGKILFIQHWLCFYPQTGVRRTPVGSSRAYMSVRLSVSPSLCRVFFIACWRSKRTAHNCTQRMWPLSLYMNIYMHIHLSLYIYEYIYLYICHQYKYMYFNAGPPH